MPQKSQFALLLRSPRRGLVFEPGRLHSIILVRQQGNTGVTILWRWHEVSMQMLEKTWSRQGREELWRQMGLGNGMSCVQPRLWPQWSPLCSKGRWLCWCWETALWPAQPGAEAALSVGFEAVLWQAEMCLCHAFLQGSCIKQRYLTQLRLELYPDRCWSPSGLCRGEGPGVAVALRLHMAWCCLIAAGRR